MKAISGVYNLNNGRIVGVDRSLERDKTAICFAKVTKDAIHVIKSELIENDVNIEDFIHKHNREVFEKFEEENYV